MHKFTNQLIHESSPYLLQHAHNPVNWYPWGSEALTLAKKENKPILVSIGYSSCHWCHVMEKESFEDEATAKIMNENFVNIKIDREERPDLDHIYMDAVQAMTGAGGWPLNVFLTPDQKPFFGGTYFPPKRAYNRPSWQEVLLGVSQAFREKRSEIDAQSENLTKHIIQSNSFGLNKSVSANVFTKEKIIETFENIMKSADRQWGGFGGAPKFPQTFSIQFLLRYYYTSGDTNDSGKEALDQALLSIDKMIDGGIYDQLGGGFARYSTDSEWLVPHFEKMLYDNALLVSVISEAYQITKRDRYREIIHETIGFLQREMMHPGGGFYSALDADSEGVEGKFYVWDYEEVKEVLSDDADLFCSFFDITPKGNFSEIHDPGKRKNILWRKKKEEEFCDEKNISIENFRKIIQKGKEKLLEERGKRIRPQLDDKILLGWNALMNAALGKAFAATGNEEYRELALKNMQFLLEKFKSNHDASFYHTWKNGSAKHPAFLDDYAYLIQALILMQEITTDTEYLEKAKEITEYVIENFGEGGGGQDHGFFFYTHKDQSDVLVRKKEVYDGAQPSGNAVMADNLYRLSIYFDLPAWKEKSLVMAASLGETITRYPASFGVWANLLGEIVFGTGEIAIVGTRPLELHKQVLSAYIPFKILMCSGLEGSQFPLLYDKKKGDPALIYLCRNFTCQKPVTSVNNLLALLRSK